MRKAPEVVREVGIDDVRVTPEQQLLHLYDGLLGIAPGTIAVDFRWKIGFEDRLQHQQRCCHADPIPHARDAQRPEFAVGLRYQHSSDWLWSVSLLPERKRQLVPVSAHGSAKRIETAYERWRIPASAGPTFGLATTRPSGS